MILYKFEFLIGFFFFYFGKELLSIVTVSDVVDLVIGAVDFTMNPRVPPGTSSFELKDRTRYIFVALEATIE